MRGRKDTLTHTHTLRIVRYSLHYLTNVNISKGSTILLTPNNSPAFSANIQGTVWLAFHITGIITQMFFHFHVCTFIIFTSISTPPPFSGPKNVAGAWLQTMRGPCVWVCVCVERMFQIYLRLCVCTRVKFISIAAVLLLVSMAMYSHNDKYNR